MARSTSVRTSRSIGFAARRSKKKNELDPPYGRPETPVEIEKPVATESLVATSPHASRVETESLVVAEVVTFDLEAGSLLCEESEQTTAPISNQGQATEVNLVLVRVEQPPIPQAQLIRNAMVHPLIKQFMDVFEAQVVRVDPARLQIPAPNLGLQKTSIVE